MSGFLDLRKFKKQAKIGQGQFGKVYKVDENRDSRHRKQLSIDTRKNPKVVADRKIQLLLSS